MKKALPVQFVELGVGLDRVELGHQCSPSCNTVQQVVLLPHQCSRAATPVQPNLQHSAACSALLATLCCSLQQVVQPELNHCMPSC